jgi:DNA gyrase subunit A
LLLADEKMLRQTVSDELAEVAKTFSTPRRTVLLESAGQPAPTSAGALEVPDEPCRVLLSSTGLLARTTDDEPLPVDGPRARHDVIVSSVLSTARGEVGAVTSAGRVLRLGVLDLPALPRTATSPNLAGGAQLSEFLQLARDERVLALMRLDGPGIALGTEQGVVKRVQPDYPGNRAEFEVVRLEAGDRVVGAVELAEEGAELVFVTSAAQVLRFPAASVRSQGRAAAGMAGIRLGAGEQVVYFGAVDPAADNVLVTVAGSSAALPGTVPGSAKVTSLEAYPGKGRATGGVRCQRFLRGEDRLVLAWAGPVPGRAASAAGVPVQLPDLDPRRDASGTELPQPVAAVG